MSGVLFRRCDPFPYSTTTSKTTKTATATAAAATTVTIAILTRVGHHVCDCLRLVQRRRPRLLVHPAEPAEALREHGLDAIEHLLQKNSKSNLIFKKYIFKGKLFETNKITCAMGFASPSNALRMNFAARANPNTVSVSAMQSRHLS